LFLFVRNSLLLSKNERTAIFRVDHRSPIEPVHPAFFSTAAGAAGALASMALAHQQRTGEESRMGAGRRLKEGGKKRWMWIENNK